MLVATFPAAAAPSAPDEAKAASSSAAGPAPRRDTALLSTQEKLRSVAERIKALSGDRGSGYSNIVLSPETHELTLYWKGTLPRSVLQVTRQPGADVTVRVTQARYSKRELDQARARLASDGSIWRQGLVSYSPLPDGSGLEVGLRPGASTAIRSPLSRVGVITRLRTQQHVVPLLGRWADSPPFWGGSVYVSAAGNACTNGFGIHKTQFTAYFMLTVYHCRPSTGGLFKTS
jgi:hypothetical protein